MKEKKLQILKLRLRIVKDIIATAGVSIIAVLGALLEGVAKFSKYALISRAMSGEDLFDVELESIHLFDTAGDFIEDIGESRKEIKKLKQELKTKKEERKAEEVLSMMVADQDILTYAKSLIEKLNELEPQQQKVLITVIKSIIKDYVTKYMDYFDKYSETNEPLDTNYLNITKQTTLRKLAVIEKAIETIKKNKKKNNSEVVQEEQILSMITPEDEDPGQKHTLKK